MAYVSYVAYVALSACENHKSHGTHGALHDCEAHNTHRTNGSFQSPEIHEKCKYLVKLMHSATDESQKDLVLLKVSKPLKSHETESFLTNLMSREPRRDPLNGAFCACCS